ncbi:hypothetical protein FKM82_009728 [Ascaphus truei]
MVQQLGAKKVPINEIKINPDKLLDVQGRLEAFLAQEQDLKERAQRCFVSYLRSVYLMKNKEVFDVFKLPLAEYAQSLGLAVAPRVRFLHKAQNAHTSVAEQGDKKEEPNTGSDEEIEAFRARLGVKEADQGKEATRKLNRSAEDRDVSEDEEHGLSGEEKEEPKSTTLQFIDEDDDDCRDIDFLTVKRRDVFGVEEADSTLDQEIETSKSKLKKAEKVSRTKTAKKVLNKKFQVNTKIVFADDGDVIQQWPPAQKTAVKETKEDDENDTSGINFAKAKERLHEEDKFDKEAYRKKIKEKHREKRLKEKASRRANSRKANEVRRMT